MTEHIFKPVKSDSGTTLAMQTNLNTGSGSIMAKEFSTVQKVHAISQEKLEILPTHSPTASFSPSPHSTMISNIQGEFEKDPQSLQSDPKLSSVETLTAKPVGSAYPLSNSEFQAPLITEATNIDVRHPGPGSSLNDLQVGNFGESGVGVEVPSLVTGRSCKGQAPVAQEFVDTVQGVTDQFQMVLGVPEKVADFWSKCRIQAGCVS